MGSRPSIISFDIVSSIDDDLATTRNARPVALWYLPNRLSAATEKGYTARTPIRYTSILPDVTPVVSCCLGCGGQTSVQGLVSPWGEETPRLFFRGKRQCRRSMGLESPSFAYLGTELHALAEAKNYYRWVISRFAPFLGQRVVEVGAGIGTFSRSLLTHTPITELIAVEPGENLFPFLQKRFAGEPRVTAVHGYFGACETRVAADSVVLVNVLEHVPDDAALLHDVHEVLVPGGTILLLVPALPWIFGSLDDAFGHYRRYHKTSLADKLQAAGFQILQLSYLNFPGIFGWWLTGRVLRSRTLNSRQVRFYDRWIVPWLSQLEGRWEPPIGQSLIAIGRKIDSAREARSRGYRALGARALAGSSAPK